MATSEEHFSLAEQSAILKKPFASSLKIEMPLMCLLGRPLMQIGLKNIAELTLGHTLNAALMYMYVRMCV